MLLCRYLPCLARCLAAVLVANQPQETHEAFLSLSFLFSFLVALPCFTFGGPFPT